MRERSMNQHTKFYFKASFLLVLVFLSSMIGIKEVYSQPTDFADQLIATGFNKPEGLVFDYNGRIYVWEKRGTVNIVENGVKRANPLIDISEEVANHNDNGLNGFALDPNFQNNGYIYLAYGVDRHHLMNYGTPSYNSNTNEFKEASISRLTRYTADASDNFNSIIPGSRLILIGDSVHNGIPLLGTTHSVGSIVFGTDGTLLLCSGDMYFHETAPNNYEAQALTDGIIGADEVIGPWRSQYLGSMNGKILRVDPATGAGLPSNPFYDASNPSSPQSRVWALGVRNPFRMVIKPETGSHNPDDGDPGIFFFGEVGLSTWEEANILDGPGQNFGWPQYEGITEITEYVLTEPDNPGAPTPSGCSQSYYKFTDLISDDGTWPDPCNPGSQIPASQYHLFLHKFPLFDYKHGADISRLIDNNVVVDMTVDPSYGTPFSGNAAIGGIFYEGEDFPEEWRGYYHADFGEGWIKHIKLDSSHNPVQITPFLDITDNIPAIGVSPTEPGLFYISFFDKSLRKITYNPANLPPTAVGKSSVIYGPTPLSVDFDASDSSDPDNDPLTYSWNFADGSPLNPNVDPSHIFTAPANTPTQFDVILIVTDDDSEKDSTIVTISLNNTPPDIISTSLDAVHAFDMSSNTVLPLSATVTDAEHTDPELSYTWITSLRHFNHEHQEADDYNHVTSTELSPVGCDGIMYFYRIYLTVTDAAGLSTTVIRDIYPDCGGPIGKSDFINYIDGQSSVFDVLANDIVNGAAIDPTTVSIVDPPEFGTVSVNPTTGEITYTHNASENFDDWFSYSVLDVNGISSAVTMVTLNENSSGNTFPVEYLSVDGTIRDKFVDIDWTTSSETNNDYFTIERSSDAVIYREIGRVNGAGTVNTETNYRFTDIEPLLGRSYYRLRQTDLDGNISLSRVIEINRDPRSLGMQLTSFPNPASTGQDYTIGFIAAESRPVYLEIIDIRGNIIHATNYVATRGENEVIMSSRDMAAGIYFIRVSNYFQSETTKLIIR